MLHKLSAVWQMLRREGFKAVLKRLRWYVEKWYTSDNWWIGRLVELRGNWAYLDGCRFDLSSPVIGTPQKAGFFWGNYETGERQALAYITEKLLPVVEFGGSVGAMACVSHRYFGKPPRHVVVEANPNLIPVLTRNRDLNQGHFTIVHAALAYGAEEISFNVHPKFVKSSLYNLDTSARKVRVPTINLRQILDQYGYDRINLFCDVEGAEVGLFDHESDLLAHHVRYLSLELHPSLTGIEVVNRLLKQLAELGFTQLYNRKDNYLFRNDRLV